MFLLVLFAVLTNTKGYTVLSMDTTKNITSILLTVAIVFMNTVCVCAAAAMPASQASQHEHHQQSTTIVEPDCQHENCLNDCFDSVALLPDRDTSSQLSLRYSMDDDKWDGEAPEIMAQAYISPIATGPPPKLLQSPANTPVRRHDLLLE